MSPIASRVGSGRFTVAGVAATVALTLAGLASCSSGSQETGSLRVEVRELPARTRGAVTVTGRGGVHRAITARRRGMTCHPAGMWWRHGRCRPVRRCRA